MKHYVGIDIGGTSIKYGLINSDGKILHKDQIKTDNNGQEIIRCIQEVVNNYQLNNKISAVGVSVPGVVEETGFLTMAGAIQDFYGIHLKNILEERLSLPVTVENDAVSSALAEKWLGAGIEYSNFFTIVVGTGVGGAIILNDKVVRGAHSTAGESGFMIVNEIENNNTREATLSLNGAVHSGLVRNYFERQTLNYKKEDLNGEKIFKLALENDQLARECIDEFYQKLAIGLFNILTFLDPEVILIGGAISSNKEFLEEINHRVLELQNNHSDMGNMRLAKIKTCQFLNDAGIIGATYKAIQMDNE